MPGGLTRLLQSDKTWRGDYAVRVCILAFGLACTLALYFPSPFNRRPAIAQTGTVVQNDFEDGALQGWIPRGVDTSLKKGAAALVISGSRQPFLITDRNLANNNCSGG